MKKHLYFGSLALAALALTTSCSSDDLSMGTTSNETAQVTFTVKSEGTTLTKANRIRRAAQFSDASGADKLIYRVLDEDGNAVPSLSQVTETGVTDLKTGHSITLTLAKGQHYTVVFWAQDADCTAYTVNEDMTVDVDYSNALNNDETRDAFYGTASIYVRKDNTTNVTLTRPFAQINVGTTTADWQTAVDQGITVEKSSVTIKNCGNKLNLVDGTVSGSVDVTYGAADLPTQVLSVTEDNVTTNYKYLSMSYILPSAEGTTLVSTDYTFTPTTGGAINVYQGLENVPVQTNYRTNIVGALLTAQRTFNITVDPAYDGDNNNFVSLSAADGAQGIADALAGGATSVALGKGSYDLSTSGSLDLTSGATIQGTGSDPSETVITIPVSTPASTGADATFENVTIDCTALDAYQIPFKHVEQLVFKNCIIKGVFQTYGNATFINCQFESTKSSGTPGYCLYFYGANAKVVVDGCTFKAPTKAILVYNEQTTPYTDFFDLEVSNCTFEATSSTTDKAAIDIHTEQGGIFGVVKINNCSISGGFVGQSNNNGGLWHEYKNNTTIDTQYFYIYENGRIVQASDWIV